MKQQELKLIRITYNAKPDVPDSKCHKFPIHELTEVRTRKFKQENIELAWKFLVECKSPITKLTQILYAFDYKRAKGILQLIDEGILTKHGNWIDIPEIA